MKRLHLFEFTDLGWWPDKFRRLLTDYLQTVLRVVQPFNTKIEAIAEAMRRTDTDQVVDLCSGAGGPWPHLVGPLEDSLGRSPRVVLTDRFPNLEAGNILRDSSAPIT